MTADQLLDHLAAERDRRAVAVGRAADVLAAWTEAEDIVHSVDLPDGTFEMADVLDLLEPVTRERLRFLLEHRMYPDTDPQGDEPQ